MPVVAIKLHKITDNQRVRECIDARCAGSEQSGVEIEVWDRFQAYGWKRQPVFLSVRVVWWSTMLR
jgi:hypothetical protein